jgi:hypothetical protein
MPAPRAPWLLTIGLAFLASACADAGRGVAKAPAAGTPQSVSAAEAAVQAFTRICNRLNRDEVERSGAQFGFVPISTAQLPAEMASVLAREGGTLFTRSGGQALLLWQDSRRCELLVGGLDLPQVERSFAQLLAAYASSPELMVRTMTAMERAQQPDNDGFQLRQAAIVGARALSPAGLRVVGLRFVTRRPATLQVSMVHQVLPPAVPAQSAVNAPLPKDPVR